MLAPGWQGLAAAVMLLGLPSVRFNVTHPVLVDAAALGLAALAAGLWVSGFHAAAIVTVLIAGATKETAPIFAALFAWSPWLLAGMIVPAVIASLRTPGPDPMTGEHPWLLRHPIKASRKYHARYLLDVHPNLVTPWGASVVALGAPSLQLFATLAVAYAQITIATDTVRLYQWAAPVVAIAATTAVDARWWPLLIIGVWFNPLRGDGI